MAKTELDVHSAANTQFYKGCIDAGRSSRFTIQSCAFFPLFKPFRQWLTWFSGVENWSWRIVIVKDANRMLTWLRQSRLQTREHLIMHIWFRGKLWSAVFNHACSCKHGSKKHFQLAFPVSILQKVVWAWKEKENLWNLVKLLPFLAINSDSFVLRKKNRWKLQLKLTILREPLWERLTTFPLNKICSWKEC